MELFDPEGCLLSEIADDRFKRKDVALTYAMALRGSQRDTINWPSVNDAIIERWSVAGLKWIKERAWPLVEGRVQP